VPATGQPLNGCRALSGEQLTSCAVAEGGRGGVVRHDEVRGSIPVSFKPGMPLVEIHH